MRTLLVLPLLVMLAGCGASIPMILSAAGGAVELATNVIGMDVKLVDLYHDIMNTPPGTCAITPPAK